MAIMVMVEEMSKDADCKAENKVVEYLGEY